VPILLDCDRISPFIDKAVLKFVPNTVKYLVTNQLDNDDFLSVDFVRMVHETLRNGVDVPCVLDPEFIYVVREQRANIQIIHCIGPNDRHATTHYVMVSDVLSSLTCLPIHVHIRRLVNRRVVMVNCGVGRVVHGQNIANIDDGGGGISITDGVASVLVGKFGINLDRIT
jgi:hypothetical protein